MRAVVVARYGGPEVLESREVEIEEPGPGQIRVRLELSGVNFTDVYTRAGVYARSHTYANAPPFVIGMEGCGTVEALGEGVTGLAVGDRVAYCLSRGSYAERAVVPAWKLVPVPEALDARVATTLMLQGCTAHYLTHSLFDLAEGHTCLVHAAAGGVGQILVQLAKIRGARVLATVGSEDKAEIARGLGADETILYREVDFAAEVERLTGGVGVDVVYDGVGRATFEGSLRSLRRRGTLALFGGASGAVDSVEPLALAEAGSVFLTRPHMADYMADGEEVARRAGAMLGWAREGRVRVAIDRELALEDAAEAHRILEARETRGKVLLRIA